MSSLRPPRLGPIVGAVSESTARIWIRGGAEDEVGSDIVANRRTIGVAAITAVNGKKPGRPEVHYFRLRREFDRTGIITLGADVGLSANQSAKPLAARTKYGVHVATLTVDDPFPDDDSIDNAELLKRLPDPKIWWRELQGLPKDQCQAEFTTFPADSADPGQSLAFILGSCRYPGLLWKVKHADAIFGPLFEEAQGRGERKPVEFVVMAGDQIYADMLNRHVPVGLADTFEEFQSRYHGAFGSRNMRTLLRHVPTYMILDDHEIEDNWTQDRITRAHSRRVFNLAINAYQSYQWIHGPRTFGKRLYYRFNCGGYPFFVLDTRTQRFVDDIEGTLDDNHLLGRPSLDQEEPSQLELLLEWLCAQQKERQNTPKFIVTSSVFAPNPMSARTGRNGSAKQKVEWAEASDSWPAFPQTRKAILSTILDNGIQNVVFLSGDIHCSNVAALKFSGNAAAKKLKAFCITSSAFYWPFPFADGEPSNFVHDSTAKDQRDTFEIDATRRMDYKAWNFTQEDNFCRVDVDRAAHRLWVRPFGTDGKPISRGGRFGKPAEIASELELHPW